MNPSPDIRVPEQVVVNTGEEGDPSHAMLEFFLQTIDYLELDDFTRKMKINTEYRSVATGLVGSAREIVVGADTFVQLVINDTLVASAMFRRDDRNWVEVSCASYLTEEVIAKVKRRCPPYGRD